MTPVGWPMNNPRWISHLRSAQLPDSSGVSWTVTRRWRRPLHLGPAQMGSLPATEIVLPIRGWCNHLRYRSADCITHGYSNDRPSGVCDSNLSALNVYTDSLLVQVIPPMGNIILYNLNNYPCASTVTLWLELEKVDRFERQKKIAKCKNLYNDPL